MPCSGLNSATSFTSLRLEQQIDRRRAVARAAGVVGDQADALAASGAKPCARSTSMPVSTGAVARAPATAPDGAEVAAGAQRASAQRLGGTSVSADAAIVATRARSGVTSPLPSGCTRFDRKTTNTPRRRIDPERRAGEAGVAERSDRQQLAAVRRVRRVDVPAEPAHVRDRRRRRRRRHLARPSAATGCARRCSVPPSSSIRQKIATGRRRC